MTEDIFQASITDHHKDVSQMSEPEIRSFILEEVQRNAVNAQQAGVGPNPPASLERFYELLSQAVANQQRKDGDPRPIKVVEEFPPTHAEGEVITFSLRQREPATFSQDKPFSGKKNYKPILREAIPDPKNPGYITLIMGQWFDNLVELSCWALTNKQANHRARWLEDLMLSYTWYFRYHGVAQLLYQGREQDSRYREEDMQFMVRPLLYYLRTEKLYSITEKSIDELVVKVQLATPEEFDTASF